MLRFLKLLQANQWNRKCLQRTVEGLTSVMLSLRKCPAIRYQANSDMTYKLAEAVRVGRPATVSYQLGI